MMQQPELRLECLKLAHTHGRSEAEVIGRAKVYEAYLLGHEVEEKVEAKSETPKVETNPQSAKPQTGKKGKSGNLDSLI